MGGHIGCGGGGRREVGGRLLSKRGVLRQKGAQMSTNSLAELAFDLKPHPHTHRLRLPAPSEAHTRCAPSPPTALTTPGQPASTVAAPLTGPAANNPAASRPPRASPP